MLNFLKLYHIWYIMYKKVWNYVNWGRWVQSPPPSPSTIIFEPFFLIFCPTRGEYFNIVLSFKFVNCYSQWKNYPYRTHIYTQPTKYM